VKAGVLSEKKIAVHKQPKKKVEEAKAAVPAAAPGATTAA